jgi:hypothetical protein
MMIGVDVPSFTATRPRNCDERVARGVALLDDRGPTNWHRRVNPETLDVYDPFACVLGQVYGNYTEGLIQLQLTLPAAYFGFDCGPDDRVEVNAAWRRALAARSS